MLIFTGVLARCTSNQLTKLQNATGPQESAAKTEIFHYGMCMTVAGLWFSAEQLEDSQAK